MGNERNGCKEALTVSFSLPVLVDAEGARTKNGTAATHATAGIEQIRKNFKERHSINSKTRDMDHIYNTRKSNISTCTLPAKNSL